jgi:predicted RNA methylase
MTPPAPQAAAIARLSASQNTKAARLLAATAQLLASLERGIPLDAHLLREAMTAAFEASDQLGPGSGKTRTRLRKPPPSCFCANTAPASLNKAGTPARALAMIEKLSALLPSHTRRSEESDQFQQFSTPLGLGFLMGFAAQLTPGELVLEPSAGNGLLAIHAEIAGAQLALNELAETRRALVSGLFPETPVTQFNAEQIDDYLDPAVQPAIVLMNPPFSASPGIERTMRDATVRHIRSALRRLPDGGRLVALTAAGHDPTSADIGALYADLSDRVSFVFTASVDGRIYARHGANIDTRLTVIDRIPEQPDAALVSAGHATSLAELLALLESELPPRPPSSSFPAAAKATPSSSALAAGQSRRQTPSPIPATSHPAQQAEEVRYEPREAAVDTRFSDRLYEPYEVQSITITGARPHPTKLVQSAAMASVRPPKDRRDSCARCHRYRAAGFDRRKPDGASPRRNPRRRMGRSLDRRHAARVRQGFPTQLYERYAV